MKKNKSRLNTVGGRKFLALIMLMAIFLFLVLAGFAEAKDLWMGLISAAIAYMGINAAGKYLGNIGNGNGSNIEENKDNPRVSE